MRGKEAAGLFEERGADEITEFRPYRATAWQRISEETEQSAEVPVISVPQETVRDTGRFLNGISDVLKPIRKLISEHESWLVITVVLLLVCDCDDDLELLIAVAILLLPMLNSWLQ